MSADNDLPNLPVGFPVQKTYLGDSVYCSPGRFVGEWILYTDNGRSDDPRNLIYLDPTVMECFRRFVERSEPLISDWVIRQSNLKDNENAETL